MIYAKQFMVLTIYLLLGIYSQYSSWTVTSKPVLKSEIFINSNTGLVLLNEEPYTGIVLDYNHQQVLIERIQYRRGKKNGLHQKYFSNGELSFKASFKDGKRTGISRTWWSNGNLRSEYQYRQGKGHGLQKEWYKSGSIFKHIHLEDGQATGLQQSWRENGKLFNNYEINNGKIYGLKRSKLCFSLDNEIIQ